MRHSDRESFVDVLKGIGIVLVVIGHVYWQPISSVIYIFHMPLFFLVGGYLFRPREAVWAFARRKAWQLLLPYATFILCIGGPLLIQTGLDHGLPAATHQARAMLLGGERLVGPLGVFWFPTCYLASLVIYNAMSVRLSQGMLDACAVALLALAYVNALAVPQFWLPFALNVCAMGIPILHIGTRVRPVLRRSDRIGLMALAGAGALVYAGFVLWGQAEPMGMKRANYGLPVVTLAAAVAWTLLLAQVSKYVTRLPRLARPLIYLGEASLVVMFLHQPIQMALQSQGIDSAALRTLAAIGLSALAYKLFQSRAVTRTLFLGRTAA